MHRSAALFKYANQKRGNRKFPDITETSEFQKGDSKLLQGLERKREEALAFQFSARTDANLRSLEFANLFI
jgi:hypothetical protein